jgi:hypothetical protein
MVVGTAAPGVSIQWVGRETPEIYMANDIRAISKASSTNGYGI